LESQSGALEVNMNNTHRLPDMGQSIWLDTINRNMLADGTLRRYRDEFCVTGLTSNPTIFDEAIGGSTTYDESILSHAEAGISGEDLFLTLALEDLREAAELFQIVFDRTGGSDGWVSMEISPLLAGDTRASIAAAKRIHDKVKSHNLLVKIPGTPAGIPAIEESIYAGVPINVTLLFSREQYIAAAEAYIRGVERRLEAGLNPHVPSVASLFVSRWDKAVADKVPAELRNKLGIAVAGITYPAYLELFSSPRWRNLAAAGAERQRLLWASTGAKDPKASDVLYVEALVAPDTINTMPEKTLRAFAERGRADRPMSKDGADAEKMLAAFRSQGIDVAALADRLQREGTDSFTKSWNQLLKRIADKSRALANAH
jgi:transaldolase